MKTFVTMGQDHAHVINGQTVDKDCVYVIDTLTEEGGRAKAFELFGRKFCTTYVEQYWEEDHMKYYPNGYVGAHHDPDRHYGAHHE